MSAPKGVEAVERAFQILNCFTEDEADLPLAELAKRSGLYKSTILRLAVSLEKYGYLNRNEAGRYNLGPTTLRLGTQYRRSLGLDRIVRSELKRLSEATNETASYYVRDHDRRVCLFRCEPTRSIRHSIIEGSSLPLTKASSGRILLAYSEPLPPKEAPLREIGYAISHGERDPEVASIAMPVFSGGQQLHGAVAVSGLVTRFTDENQPSLIAALSEARDRLCELLAY